MIIAHTPGLLGHLGIDIHNSATAPRELGSLAVKFFFVLSGYLITYLLLVERSRYGSIDLKAFYMRRILRIWPLYYLVLLVGMFVLSPALPVPQPLAAADAGTYAQTLAMYFAFLPNVAASFGQRIPFTDHLWSVGVEEQFYLLWPVLVTMVRGKHLLWVLAAIVLLFGVGRVAAYELQAHVEMAATTKSQLLLIRSLLLHTPLSCMAIGGFGACALFYWPEQTRRVLANRAGELVALALVVAVFFMPTQLYGFNIEIYAVLFGYLILSISTAPQSFLRMEGPRWQHLGNISYGIYGLHWVVLVGLGWLLTHSGLHLSALASSAIIYGLTLPLTVGLASLSYRYYESYFLKLKENFNFSRSRTRLAPDAPAAITFRPAAQDGAALSGI